MSIKVRVQNFQSIEDVSIEIDGLTIVSGPNNAGKSALMRAIKGVFTNADPGPLVRKGQPFCRVELDFPEGRVIWEKGKNVNRYWVYTQDWVDGKKFDKPGRGVVPEEVQAFGIKHIPVGKEKIWPQVADQWLGQVFLLDKSGSVLAESIADLDRVGRLNRSLRQSEKEKRSINAQLDVRRVDIADIEESLAGYAGLDLIIAKVDVMTKVHERLQKVFNSIGLLTTLRNSLLQNREIIQNLSSLHDVPRISQDQMLVVQKSKDSIHKVLELKQRRIKSLSDLEILSSRIDQLKQAFQSISDLTPTERIYTSIQTMMGIKKRYLKSLSDIQILQEELVSTKKLSDNLQEELQTLQLSILEEQKKETTICPECGQELPHG